MTIFRHLVQAAIVLGVTALAITSVAAAVPHPGKRVALVIGNANYKNTVALPNTVNDAKAVTQSLERLGFDVVSGVDLSRDQMNRKMKTFARKLVGADVGLFFYAGHGMQVSGENYLIPVDASLAQETDLAFEAVKVEQAVDQMLRSARIKVVILDSCRDNPLAAQLARSMGPISRSVAPSSGLSAMSAGASGTLIAFATAPGKIALDGTGQHSPFTTALLNHIETPGLDIDVMMKRVRGDVARVTGERQQPWTNSALNGEFYLNPNKPEAAASQRVASLAPVGVSSARSVGATASPITQAPKTGLSEDVQARIDLAAWDVAHNKGRGTKTDYQMYLSRFPTGLFAAQARARMAALSRPAPLSTAQPKRVASVGKPSTPATGEPSSATEGDEVALGLVRGDWRHIQRKLTNLGFSTRGVDGLAGNGTRQALRGWQASRGLPVTGYIDASQRTALMAQPIPASIQRKLRTRSASSSSQRNSRSNSAKRRSARRQRNNDSGAATAVGTAIGLGIGLAIGRRLGR